MTSCGPQDYGYVAASSVRAANGTVADGIIPDSDIREFPSGTIGITRSYWSRFGQGNGLGNGWAIKELPRLIPETSSTDLSIEGAANEVIYFEESGGTYTEKYCGNYHLSFNSGDDETCQYPSYGGLA